MVYVNWKGVNFAFRLSQKLLQGLDDYNEKSLGVLWNDALGRYIQSQSSSVTSSAVPDTLLSYVIPNLTLEEYMSEWKDCLNDTLKVPTNYQKKPLRTKAYARVGLMGNPSDGFYGTYTCKYSYRSRHIHWIDI
jgi:hypothetical protein